MKSERRVLIVTAWYPTPDNPVATTFVRDQSEILFDYFSKSEKNTVFKFSVLHMQYPIDLVSMIKGKKALRMKSVEAHEKFSVIHEQAIIPSHRVEAVQQPFRRKAIRRGFQKAVYELGGSPDFIIGVTLSGLMDAWEIKNMFGLNTPIVLHEHSVPITMHLKTESRKQKAVSALKDAFAVVIVADRQKAEIDSLYPVKELLKIWNPAHADFFNHPIKEKKSTGYIEMATVGRLSFQKAHERLLYALNIVRKEVPELRLKIIGDGENKAALLALSKQLSLEDKVTFLGSKPRHEIVQILGGSDLFALSSRYENCPVVLAEAQAIGLPCICTINGASEFIVLAENGISVEQDEKGESLGKGILKLIQALPQYRSENIRSKAYEHFSPEIFGEKFYQLYQSSQKIPVQR